MFGWGLHSPTWTLLLNLVVQWSSRTWSSRKGVRVREALPSHLSREQSCSSCVSSTTRKASYVQRMVYHWYSERGGHWMSNLQHSHVQSLLSSKTLSESLSAQNCDANCGDISDLTFDTCKLRYDCHCQFRLWIWQYIYCSLFLNVSCLQWITVTCIIPVLSFALHV